MGEGGPHVTTSSSLGDIEGPGSVGSGVPVGWLKLSLLDLVWRDPRSVLLIVCRSVEFAQSISVGIGGRLAKKQNQ